MNKKNSIKKRIITTIIAVLMCFNNVLYIMPSSVYAANNVIETTYDVNETFTGLDHTHIWSFYYDDDYHWQQCDICGKINNKHAHVLTENGGSKEYCMDSGDKAFRYVCTCGYTTKPLQVVHGRWYNYKNTDSYSRSSQIYLKNIMQITKAEFNEWYGGKTHDGFEYTWYDYDGDGLGNVFCGGPVINRTETQKGGYDSWGQQGTIAYIVGVEGDCGKHNPTDEYLALSMYLYYECNNDIDNCTRSGFVQYLKDKISSKGGNPTEHALYGYDTKYANRVTDAQFREIIKEFKGTVPHPQGWGWQWSGLRCCRDNWRLHNDIGGGRTLCENETNYDNSVTNGDINNGHWTDMWDGVSVEADVSGSKYRGNEQYTDINWPHINTASTAGTILGTNSRSEYYGKSISQLPGGTTTEWLYFADRLGKNKKVLAKYYYQYKRVGHHYYVRYRAICENGGYVYRVTSRHITSNPGDSVSWTGYVDENKKGTDVTTEWIEIPTTNANRQAAWADTAYMYIRDTIEGPYIPERQTSNPEGYLDNYSQLRYYYPLIDDTVPKAYNSNNWVIIGNGTPTQSSTLATVKVQFSDLMQFSENLVYVHIYDDDKKTIMKQFVVGQEWVPCERLNTFEEDSDFESQVWQATLQIQTEIVGTKQIYVQAKDSRGNLSELVPVTVSYIDSKGPSLTVSNLNSINVWSKSKSYTVTAKDASANFQIGLGLEDMVDATASTVRKYTFTGDVNLTATNRGKSFAIWGKDSAGNVSYETLDLLYKQVKYLDNTSPTLKLQETKNHVKSLVTVTADDYCSTIKAQGSGKTADGAGKYGFYYGISTTNNVSTATWTALQTSSTYTYTLEYNTYYIWVKDYVGNISSVKSIKTNPYWNVTYNSNNPNSINDITNIPSNQTKWSQTNLTLSTSVPTKKGYVLLYWNTKVDGSGTSYKPGETYSINADLALYAQWRPDEYKVYYDKGLSSDTSTSIANATRNTNIQSTGTNRPYTQTHYDSNVSFATLGSLKGRKYTLTFNTNIPASITKQQNNSTAVPTTVNTVTGNLPSQNKWQITGQDGTVTTNLTPTMGSTVNSPNYVSVDNASVTATALWNNKILNGYGTPTLTGWKFVGWYDNQSGANSTAVSNTTDMIRVVNTTTNMSANTNVKVTGNVTSYTVQPKTTDFNQTLYARWQRTITLTFNMNGGKYYYTDDSGNKQATNGVVLTGIYYNNADGYEFSLDDTLTSASLPNYEKQINKIDAYGTYNDNGENSKYGKYLSDETRYRFLGWSTNPNATVPDSELITYDSNHKTKYRIYDDTVLYAVWEPVLTVYVGLNNTNGNKNFSDGSSPVLSGQAVAADGTQYLSIIAYPGETVEYNVVSLGRADRELYVGFDNKITDIYENYGSWTDGYNPSTSEDTYSGQHQGLNRHISPASKYIKRSFVVPMYLGTEFSYSTSIGVGKYYIVHEMMQDSYYFKYCKGEDKEKVRFVTVLYITTNKNYNGPDDPGPDVPVIPANPDNPIHSPAEIKTTIEFEYDN